MSLFCTDAGLARSQTKELLEQAKTTKNAQSALAILDKALKLDPKSVEVLKARAKLYSKLSRHREAAADYLTITQLQPRDYDSFVHLGMSYRRTGSSVHALKAYKKAIAINPKNAWAYATTANIYQDLRQYKKSLEYNNKAHKISPNNAVILSNRSAIYRRMGKYDLALKDIRRAIKLKPKNPQMYVELGAILADKGNYKEAEKIYAMVVKKLPGGVSYKTDYAQILTRLGKYREAIKISNQAIYQNKRFATAYRTRGIAYFKQKNQNQALKDLDKCLALNPRDSRAYLYRARIHSSMNYLEQATQDFESARHFSTGFQKSTKAPELPSTTSLMEQLADYTQAIKENPKSNQAIFNRAFLLYALGDFEAAKRDFDLYAKSAKGNSDSIFYAKVYSALADLHGKRATSIAGISKPNNINPIFYTALQKYLENKASSSDLLKQNKSTFARFVVANRELAKGNKAQALEQLNWIKTYGDKSSEEYFIALLMLQRASG